MITYNVLLEVPDDLNIMEKHEVEYEAEVPVMRTVEYDVEVELMESVEHTEEWVDEEGEAQTYTWETLEPTGEYETVTKTYQEDTGETEIVTLTRMEHLIGDDVAWEIANLYTEWPGLVTPGTQLENPTKLMHCSLHTDVEDVETYIGSLIEGYALDWTLLHIQSYHGIEEIIEEEEVVGHQAQVVLSTSLGAVEGYLPPRYEDEEQTIELDKDISWLHVYQGMAPWRLV